MSEIININLIDFLHKTGNLKIKHFYKTFKNITNDWIFQKEIKGYCKYINKNDNLCLTKIDKNNYYCNRHNNLIWKKESKIFNKLSLDIFCINKRINQKPLAISRSINIVKNDIIYEKEEKIPELIFLDSQNNNQKIEPSCPTYDEIYPPQKPDKKYDETELINKNNKKSNKINNKKHSKKPTKIFTIEDFNKINNDVRIMYPNIMNDKEEYKEEFKGINIIKLYNINLCKVNKDMVDYINEYQFVYPTDENNNVINLSSYKNRLSSINFDNIGYNINKEYLKSILQFEFSCYFQYLSGKPKINTRTHKFIQSIINKIPK